MRHFIDPENSSTVYQYEDDCDPQFIPDSYDEISAEEAEKILKNLLPKPGLEAFKTEIQAHLDAVAVAAGYDDIRSAVTYADEPAVPKFQAEGLAFRAWRSLVWDYGLKQLALVESGGREAPKPTDFIAELPKFTAPK